jgi:superfamily II DNA or RNA helicase
LGARGGVVLMELREYQKKIVLDVISHLRNNQRCCVSLATGGGKTVVFSKLVDLIVGKTMICVHREELVYQTSATLKKDHDLLLPKIKTVFKNTCVAMVQTLHNRIKKGLVNLDDYDTLIIDECHRGEFMKILDGFKGKVIGFTATPNYDKTNYFYKCLTCGYESQKNEECCNVKTKKYKEKVPLSKYYHTLINGVDIPELIKQGFLVQDDVFDFNVDTSMLVYNEFTQDYTDESISLVFGSPEAIRNTVDVYKELCLGKKTIIFNPNTLVNKRLYKSMVSEGLPVKMYDSVNSDENRAELVNWFKNTEGATLLNVQVFTTGFDCTDVEAIFLNKKTQSLNLFLQMVGRGGRITDKILKTSFRVVDMGNNCKDFGHWSSPRSWNDYFYKSEVKPCGTPKPAAIIVCHNCEAINAANSLTCSECGIERIYKGGVTGRPTRNGKPTIPTPGQIIEFCKKNNYDTLIARKIVYSLISDMFVNTNFDVFLEKRRTGELYRRCLTFVKRYYFTINRSDLPGNKVRRLSSFTNECIKQIEKGYEIRRKFTS